MPSIHKSMGQQSNKASSEGSSSVLTLNTITQTAMAIHARPLT